MTSDRIEPSAHLHRPLPGVLLGAVPSIAATGWIRQSLTRFATPVGAIVPGHFAACARIYHPFADPAAGTLIGSGLLRWHVLAARPMRGADEALEFAMHGSPDAQAPIGTLPRVVVDIMTDHLRTFTTTPDECFFALWEGFGDSIVSPGVIPTLELPHRRYHVFAGSIHTARASYSNISFSHRSANLWWPADRAWCVATEVDAAWTYVAGPESVIETLLSDSRLDALPTTADASW